MSSSELEDTKHRLAQAEEETRLLKESTEATRGQRVADLQAELDEARTVAERLREKAWEDADQLHKEQETREAVQQRVAEVKENLAKCVSECDALKTAKESEAVKVKQLGRVNQELTLQASSAREELRQASEIASAAFLDLPRSAEDACRFYSTSPEGTNDQRRLFWLQF